ncbi:MAG: hypothetical protein GY822_14880 [Deltaproteobacteria bacterium]|nr:hypothetical protein [Deltaproteobacteria bacterium]
MRTRFQLMTALFMLAPFFSTGANAIYIPPEIYFDDVYPSFGNVPRNFQLLLSATGQNSA